jgi:hypothetical protein
VYYNIVTLIGRHFGRPRWFSLDIAAANVTISVIDVWGVKFQPGRGFVFDHIVTIIILECHLAGRVRRRNEEWIRFVIFIRNRIIVTTSTVWYEVWIRR